MGECAVINSTLYTGPARESYTFRTVVEVCSLCNGEKAVVVSNIIATTGGEQVILVPFTCPNCNGTGYVTNFESTITK